MVWRHTPAPGGGRLRGDDLRRRQEALARAPLFTELPKRHLRQLAAVTGISRYQDGSAIVKEGSSDSTFYVILEGGARVFVGSKLVARLNAGDFFGEVSLLDAGPRVASVLAEGPTVCLSLAGKNFRDVLAKAPLLSMRIMKELARRLRSVERPTWG